MNVVSAAKRVKQRYHYATASETERIEFHPEVRHGSDIKLTGKIDFGSEPFLVTLGSDITIADGVRFITHDGAVRLFRDEEPDLHIYAPITVGSHVFIGIGAIIMPGVTVGDWSIVAAGSVVTKDVPPRTVVGGVPAKQLKTLEEYKDGALAKGIRWPAGKYDDKWKSFLIRTIRDPQ